MKKVFLVEDTITNDEIDALADWLKGYPRLTKGALTEQFEEAWAEKLGTKHAVFVNSGSSANLLMLYALMESGKISRGDSVIVPAISWATDLAPVIQLGLKPILCDVNKKNLAVCTDELRAVIKQHAPKVLMLVSVLGLVPNMEMVQAICKEKDVILLEDVCESLGSKWGNRNLGTFGLMSSFSLYFGHHLSTIEGGMVCTDDTETYHLLRSIRSHGWGREYPSAERERLEYEFNVSKFNSMFTFYNAGFNLRSTDLQAFLGLSQIKKWDTVCETREKNFRLYHSLIPEEMWKPTFNTYCYVSNFAYPLITTSRASITERLTREEVECRPLISGNMARQPLYIKHYGEEEYYPVADTVHNCGMYLPNHPSLSEEDITRICNIVKEEVTHEV
jgi:CDP-6-deoxy-D-xylo-4-hexulose-3-dehydrase